MTSSPDPTTDRPALPEPLLATRVVAVLRGSDPRAVVDAGLVLAAAGVTCLEVAFTTPGAADAIAELRERLPLGCALGAGTVLEPAQVELAAQAGATFLVTPAPCLDVVAAALVDGVPVLAGAFTAGEVLAAWRSGAAAVKIFPAATGGPQHVRDLRGPLPDVPLIPTGGIGVDEAGAYLAAGAIAVGLGSALTGRLDGASAPEGLAERARTLLDSVAGRS
jgi:2-dehydro-3-deoxyphosphogluconate aldolase/(4S)-4-hydroxy-2-oxoglutarate aldolase